VAIINKAINFLVARLQHVQTHRILIMFWFDTKAKLWAYIRKLLKLRRF
jgi:hypothetical protein